MQHADYVLKYFNDLNMSGEDFRQRLTEAHELVRQLRAQVARRVWW